MSKHTHVGHRARMKQRFLESGGQGFAQHELLELLLYYAVPRVDTNDLAHRLIEEFGSLSGVLGADEAALSRVEGVGKSTALYLRAMGAAVQRCAMQRTEQEDERTVYDTPERVAAFMMPRYVGVSVERVYLLLFDNGMRMIDCYHVCDGSVAGVAISPRRVVERAYRKGAAAAILTHNHPGGIAVPSGDDIRITRRLDEAFRLMEIPLLEHYVFTERSYAPIMSAHRVENEREYAASSLFDLLHQRLSAKHDFEIDQGGEL